MSTIDSETRNKTLNTISYNERLKEKITAQAKRLTQLAIEKEELIELLREKTMTLDVSLDSNLNSLKNNRNAKSANPQKYKNQNYLKELIIAKDKIKELEENKRELINLKKTVSDRLYKANNDIDKTKESLIIMEKEKKNLMEQVYSLTSDKEQNSKKIQKITKNYDEQIKDLIQKNKKLFQDNKQLVIQIKKITHENNNLKKDNISLKNINSNFTKTIDNLTHQLNHFKNEINYTIKKQEIDKYEKLVDELNSKIYGKNREILKMKELQNNYELLENELTNAVDEKDKDILILSKHINKLNSNNTQLENDKDILQNKISDLLNENQKMKTEILSLKKKNDQITNQFQTMNNMKNSQINNLKKMNEVLEEKVIKIEKNKKYLEHLLTTTHPSRDLVSEILELYYQISGLENEKKNIEKEYLYQPLNSKYNDINKEIKKKEINNISTQITKLKKYLKSMEEGITIN